MIIRIDGSQIILSGRFTHLTHQDIIDSLTRRGAQIHAKMSDRVDFMIAGPQTSSKTHSKAIVMGIPILDEHQLRELLLHGEIELDESVDILPRSELFGEMRSLLQQGSAPSAWLWQQTCKLIDRCAPEELDAMVHYVENFVGQWDGKMHGCIGTSSTMSSPEDHVPVGQTWASGIPGELRVLPDHWLGELMYSGQGSPKHRLVRGLSLEHSALNGVDVCKLLLHPVLDRVTHVVLPLDKNLTKQIVDALHNEMLIERVSYLRMNRTSHSVRGWFEKASEQTDKQSGALEHLDVTQYHASFDWRTLKLPYFDRLTTLQVWGHQLQTYLRHMPRGITRLLIDHPNLPAAVRALELSAVHETLRELSLYNYPPKTWKKLFDMDYRGELDVFDIGVPHVPSGEGLPHQRLHKRHVPELNESLRKAKLLARVKELRLGLLHDLIDHEPILKAHPHLTISV